MEDAVRHNCGFCVAHTLHDAYSFIRSLQHRGREAAGIAAVGEGRIDVIKWAGGVDRYLSRAETYTWVGEYDKAVEQIAQALEFASIDFSAALLRVDPLWAPLRDHPRYQELVGEGDVGR